MESNEVLAKLPKHLMNLVIDQPYHTYTEQDHAVWRYVLRQSICYLPAVAHHSYLEGLKRTGISIDRIPHMYGMNRILEKIGWAAVAVDGFIPPAAFMEFQAYNVLVIAADIRPIDQILYTPAPDIIHEAAGHAPIIADEAYSNYLVEFGKLGSKAFSSAYDNKMYEAIRHLSILKANPYTTATEIAKAESELAHLNSIQELPSEMSLLRNLHWWTVEYGLIGSIENPKIYGAGLLSSIGESYNCLKANVKKIPYTIDAQHHSFDITTEQPQLFVTPDFENLNKVLHEFKKDMALEKGGYEGLEKALRSGSVATITYNSGLQVSGVLSKIHSYRQEPVYLHFTGPVMLSTNCKMLEGHGKDYHREGFGSPIGKLKGMNTGLSVMSTGDLAAYGISIGTELNLEFESGVTVAGTLERILQQKGKTLIFTFSRCSVRFQGEYLFQPEWGMYDMAIGETIDSAHAGPADADAYNLSYSAPTEKTIHIEHTPESLQLHTLYAAVHSIREQAYSYDALKKLWEKVKSEYPSEWLLLLEICEVAHTNKEADLEYEITQSIIRLINSENEKLITDGLTSLGVK